MLNTFDGLLFHIRCYFEDHLFDEDQSLIVGVARRTYYLYGLKSQKRTEVICKVFTMKDLN